MTFQSLILKLSEFWASRGCALQQPLDVEVGAGTMHPETFLRVLGPAHWNVAYVQPSRRPADGRFGENPNRLFKHHQFQVILKPSPDEVQSLYLESLEACGFVVRSQIIWHKPRFALGRGDYHWQHEPCLYTVRKGGTGHWQGARDQATVWSIANAEDDGATVHGTQKPVACMRRPIENNSAEGDAVYEPFSGSGTTLIAAERTGRRCYALELDPRYVDVAVTRWQTLTGESAVLEGDGRSFDEIAAGRAGG